MSETLDFSTAYPEVLVLVGSRTGNAELVAEEVAEMLDRFGFQVRVVNMMNAAPSMLLDYYQLILCTSTYGEGALPDAAADFYEALQREAPDLSHLAFGVISLGDSFYEHFAQGGRLFQEVLEELGAVEVLDMHTIDQGPRPDQVKQAQQWSLTCAAAFAEAFAPVEGEAVVY